MGVLSGVVARKHGASEQPLRDCQLRNLCKCNCDASTYSALFIDVKWEAETYIV
jgi:hypothetical protein